MREYEDKGLDCRLQKGCWDFMKVQLFAVGFALVLSTGEEYPNP